MLLLDLDTLDCAGPKAEGEAATANRPPRATANCPPRAPPPPNPSAHIHVTTAQTESGVTTASPLGKRRRRTHIPAAQEHTNDWTAIARYFSQSHRVRRHRLPVGGELLSTSMAYLPAPPTPPAHAPAATRREQAAIAPLRLSLVLGECRPLSSAATCTCTYDGSKH